MRFATTPTGEAEASLRDVQRRVYWLDSPDRPAPRSHLSGDTIADLVIVGGGFTGLWSALLAHGGDLGTDVMVLESGRIGDGGSGRNGGFVSASLTHGFGNGLSRWPDDMPTLLELGMRNLDDIERFVALNTIECEFRRAGEIAVAVAEHQVEELRDAIHDQNLLGVDAEFLDRDAITSMIHSDSYRAGLLDRRGVALADPARLVWGMARVAEVQGVRIHENTQVIDFEDHGDTVSLRTPQGRVRARRVIVATNAFPSLIPAVRHRVVPVYDYVLITEPLTDVQWNSVGWAERQGLSDVGNQFHYYRPTADGRILWGGYDAVYHPGNGFGPQFENDEDSYRRLATHFLQTFPQLEGVRFSHAWGGAIDTCSRFTAFWGTEAGGKVAYAAGFTGLGVGSSRFAAHVMLDLLSGCDTQRTRLEMVKTKPLPFPPEPLRSLGIKWTTLSLQKADVRGHRNLWLRILDRLGMGFDS